MMVFIIFSVKPQDNARYLVYLIFYLLGDRKVRMEKMGPQDLQEGQE